MAEQAAEGRLFRLFKAHPYYQRLERRCRVPRLTRQLIEVPPGQIDCNFVTGTIANSTSFRASPVALVDRDQKILVAAYYLGPGSAGHAEYVHGGLISTILDECCGRAAACSFNTESNSQYQEHSDVVSGRGNSVGAVTVTLTVEYKSPMPINSIAFVEAIAQSSDTYKSQVKAQMWHIEQETDIGRLVAVANAKFAHPAVFKARM